METDYIRQGETVHVQAAGELSWARIKFSTVSP